MFNIFKQKNLLFIRYFNYKNYYYYLNFISSKLKFIFKKVLIKIILSNKYIFNYKIVD